MKITVESNGEVITMELHDDNTIFDLIPKLKLMLLFCGYTQQWIDELLKEHE